MDDKSIIERFEPCPFCGTEPNLHIKYAKYSVMIFIRCPLCKSQGPLHTIKIEDVPINEFDEVDELAVQRSNTALNAVKTWNRRISLGD